MKRLLVAVLLPTWLVACGNRNDSPAPAGAPAASSPEAASTTRDPAPTAGTPPATRDAAPTAAAPAVGAASGAAAAGAAAGAAGAAGAGPSGRSPDDAARDRRSRARAAPTTAATGDTYTVAKGDTLASIARARGLNAQDLARWNGIDDPRRLQIGQQLRLAAPQQ